MLTESRRPQPSTGEPAKPGFGDPEPQGRVPAPNDRSQDHLVQLMGELSTLTTEGTQPGRGDLNRLSTTDLVREMNGEDAKVAVAVGEQSARIAEAVDRIVDRLHRGGRLIYQGAGTAGRIGVVDASECPPTFGTDPDLVVGLIAGGPEAMRTSVEDSEDDRRAGVSDLNHVRLRATDVVVGISASGRTPYVVAGLRHARGVGALTIAVACNEHSEIGAVAEIPIEVVVGPEFVAGATRLKSGTAQKLVLNMLSTLAMIRLGKTYNGVMVDLRATNEKLRARSLRTVMSATGLGAGASAKALEQAKGQVKVAILMLRNGLTPDAAGRAVAKADGDLARAIEETAHT